MPETVWNHKERRYYLGAAMITPEQVRQEIDDMIAEYSNTLYTESQDLINDFTQDKFFAEAQRVRRDIEYLHAAATIVALGGIESTTRFATEQAGMWQTEESRLADQLRWFDNLIYDIFIGAVALSAYPRRVSNYALAVFGTYETVVRLREQAVDGISEERRVLTAKESCRTCIEEASYGWSAVGTRRNIGDSECLFNCRCYFEFR